MEIPLISNDPIKSQVPVNVYILHPSPTPICLKNTDLKIGHLHLRSV